MRYGVYLILIFETYSDFIPNELPVRINSNTRQRCCKCHSFQYVGTKPVGVKICVNNRVLIKR